MVPILTKHRANQREGRQNLKKTVLPVVNYEVEKLGCLYSKYFGVRFKVRGNFSEL